MPATVTNVFQGQNMSIWTVAWGADADTTATVTHGLVGTPLLVIITPTAAAAATVPNIPTAIGATTITITKNGVGAGSAAASPCTVTVMRPHSIIQ